jgi:hypothetical protein
MKYTVFALIMSLVMLFIPTHRAQAATPTPTQTTTAKVIIRLLDANNQPLVGVTVNLILNLYGSSIEEVPFGSCITDETGSCSITVTDPPRLRSGKIEGFIDLGSYGRQLIGWKGEQFEITLQLYLDGKLATVSAPLDAPYEGQTEQPTDAPLSTSTPIITYVLTSTSSPIPLTDTSIQPTATVAASATPTLTPQPTVTQTSIPPTPLPPSHPSQRSGWAWIGLGLMLFTSLGTAFAIYYHRQHKHRKID